MGFQNRAVLQFRASSLRRVLAKQVMVLGVAVALGRQGRRRSQRSDESDSSSPQRTTASVIDSWHRARRDASIPSPRTPLKTRTTEQIASPTTGPPPPQPARSRTPRRGRTSCDADESAEGAAAAPSLIGIEHWQPALLKHFVQLFVQP